jgi:GalNAc-alpha-(1->4)-GalNAc-alpha-(1->3)-diNAcBac-PP-undecaprenol alpha-1,4-N-acetyl-D-galactosaminyltransferase
VHASGDAPRAQHLLLVSASLEGGGAERQLAELANYWAAGGIKVTLVTWTGVDADDFYDLHSGVRRVRLNMMCDASGFVPGVMLSIRRIRALRRVLLAEKPDSVLSFLTETNVLTILASLGLRTRLVISERANPAFDTTVSKLLSTLRRQLYWLSYAVVAQTDAAAQWITHHCGARTRVIPNVLRDLPLPGRAREPLIVAVGRLARQKGFDLLLRAFALVAAEFPGWSVAILGEGRERDSLLQLCSELGVTDRVALIGRVADVDSWLARASIVVQPSRFEGFPNALLEAMGMGAAVISADCPSGPSELIENGVNGRLVPVEDVAALTAALRQLLADPDMRVRLGREAGRVRERFHAERIMDHWNQCLLAPREILTGRSQRR